MSKLILDKPWMLEGESFGRIVDQKGNRIIDGVRHAGSDWAAFPEEYFTSDQDYEILKRIVASVNYCLDKSIEELLAGKELPIFE